MVVSPERRLQPIVRPPRATHLRLEYGSKKISFWNNSYRWFYRSRGAYPRFGAHPPSRHIPKAKAKPRG